MNSERWERVKGIFQAARSMSGDERSLFLQTACADDKQTYAEVERLLAHCASAEEFFRTPVPGNPAGRPWLGHSFFQGQVVCQRFVIRQFIGCGGMGEVYAADDKLTGVAVALKTIRGEINDDERLWTAIRKEVQIARRVTHPNVCRIHDLFEHCDGDSAGRLIRDIQILSMELLEGETLAVSLKRRRYFPVSESIPMFRQIADGLRAVHRAGIVHRDLKPANVMLASPENSDMRPVLTDFGLARIDSRDSSWSDISGIGAILGTPRYMSPEQLEGCAASVASDIYSFGAIWYEMLTGRSPYESPSPTSTIFKRLTEDAPSPRIFAPNIDTAVENAILKCLERNPSHRFADAEDLLSWFDNYCSPQSSKLALTDPSSGRGFTSKTARPLQDGPLSAIEPVTDGTGYSNKTVEPRIREGSKEHFEPMASGQGFLSGPKAERKTGTLRVGEASKRQKLDWWIPTLGIGVLALIAGLRLYLTSQASPVELRITPLASYPGFQRDPAFSPDGNQIAFAWTGPAGTTTHIYVKVIGTDTPLRLTSEELSDTHPAWAPDGKSIAFLRALSQAKTGIYQIAPLGGPTRQIAQIYAGLYASLGWSRDGRWLVTTGRQRPNAPSSIFVISAESGEQRPLTFGDTHDEFCPSLSLDSRFLAFSRMNGDADWAILTVPVDNRLQPHGAPRRIRTPYGLNRQSAWTSDGKELIFANGGSITRLWRASARNNTPPQELPVRGEVAYEPALAPQGNRLAYAHDFNNANIWSVAIKADGKGGPPTSVISSARSSWIRPNAISPDGKKVAFESNRSGPYGVWLSNVDGSGGTLLFGSTDYISGSPAWSPDGRWVAFDTRKDKRVQVYVSPSEGGMARRITQTEADNMVPHWSHDGKWIYFTSNRTGQFEVFKVSPEGGNEIQLTQNGGFGPQESPDGKFVFYTRTRAISTSLVKLPAEGGQEIMVLPSVHERWWAVSDKGVWFMRSAGADFDSGLWPLENPTADHGYISLFSFANGSVDNVIELPKSPAGGLAISRDQRMLMFDQVDHRASEILLIENFK